MSGLAGCLEDEDSLGGKGPLFNPPLYKQRYSAVLHIARKLKPRKVVDIGCADCKLLRLLKRESYIEDLIGVDVNPVVLEMNSHLVKPLITDHLHPRLHPLHMALMQGSIAQPDTRLCNCDLLTCIEVVEHLDSPVLDDVPYSIFGILRPHVVVMTTPNAEYNVLFPEFSGFRHPDHRFEWTRHQFQTWCKSASHSYGYFVEFGGIGVPVTGREDVGHCSQMATFTRIDDTVQGDEVNHLLSFPYIMVAEAHHPHQVSLLSAVEKLRLECEYYIYILLKSREPDYEEETLEVHIPLQDLLVFPRVKALCTNVEDIRKALEGSCIQLDESGQCAVLSVQEEEELELEGKLNSPLSDGETADISSPCECWD